MKTRITQIIITAVALTLAAVHVACPHLPIDGTTVSLLILAALPWAAPLLKSTERPVEEKTVRTQGSKLHVGNLHRSVTDEELRELFTPHGEVRQGDIIRGKGFGFVEMSDPAQAAKARQALDGSEFKGLTLRVNEARPRRSRRG